MRINLGSKKVVLGLLVVLVVIGGVALFWSARGKNPQANVNVNGTNLAPATEQEQAEAEAHKQSLNNQDQVPTIDNDGKAQVTPIISSASQSELLAFIPNVFEEGGICTATFKDNAFSFTKQSAGFKNVSTTNCEPISLTRADFARSGMWTVTLSYSSEFSAGSSQPVTFEVQ